MSNYRISWPKEHRETAKRDDRSLLAVAYDGKAAHNEFYGPCDDMAAQIVFLFAMKMHTGSTFDEAVEGVRESMKRLEERKAEKAKGGES